MFLGSKVRLVRGADNLTVIFNILNISQPYRPPRPVTGITFFLLYFTYCHLYGSCSSVMQR
jgi:hypothetical protein